MLTSIDTYRTDFESATPRAGKQSVGNEVFDLSDPACVAKLKRMAQ